MAIIKVNQNPVYMKNASANILYIYHIYDYFHNIS